MSSTTSPLSTLELNRTPEEVEADKVWESADGQDSDIVAISDKQLEAAMKLIAVIAGMCGPEGKIIGSVFSGIAGLIPLLNPAPPKNDLEQLRKTVEKIFQDQQIQELVDKCAAFNEFVTGYQDSLTIKSDESQEVLDSHIIPRLQDLTDEGGILGKALGTVKDKVSWDDAKGRLAIVNAVTCYINAYSLLCRIYAQRAQLAKEQGKEDAYHTHKTTYESHLKAMDIATSNRISSLNGWIDGLKKSRIAELKITEGDYTHSAGTGFGFINSTVYTFAVVDEHKQPPKQLKVFESDWSEMKKKEKSESAKKAKSQAEEYFNQTKPQLEVYAERCFRNTRAISATWSPILDAAKGYLKPSLRKKLQTKDGRVVVENVAPQVLSWEAYEPSTWLSDATHVAYAYKLSTGDGDSDMSNFTDWLEIKPAPGGSSKARTMPIIGLDDNECLCKTKRVVFHKKMVGSGDQTTVIGDAEPYMQAAVVEPVKGLYQYKDL
ncbi:hypothetical protein RhiJN_27605 [Ceratobasidium sp. AG-Ba]|nr:hypothetical protein RhiJN_27605 [Ceratobasidium sp. AG-Ba]QRW14110.1 hypothetical protein RhiLY_13109 [Ceratobasidium sp. AG-Ba]